MEHLAQEKIEAYARQRLNGSEMLMISDHVAECVTCRQRLERSMNVDPSFYAVRSEVFGEETVGHLTMEDIASYSDQSLSDEALQIARDHLTICEQCALEVEDLRTFRNEVAPSLDREFRPKSVSPSHESWWKRARKSLPNVFGVSPVPAFGAALGVLLVAVIGWLILRTQWANAPTHEVVVVPSSVSEPSPATNLQPTPEANDHGPANVVAQLKDGESVLTLDEKGILSGADKLPTDYQDRLRKAITSQRIERSSQLDGLTRPPSSLMSSNKETVSFTVLDPAGDVVLTTQPTFRWTRMTAATGYVVEIYDDKFQLVTSSPQVTGQAWTAQQALARGKVYSWQVKAIKDGEEFVSPGPPAPQAKFRILDQVSASELAKAKRSYGSSHLTMALLYAEAGLLKEAEQELHQLQRVNPDSELVRKLLKQVQALRR